LRRTGDAEGVNLRLDGTEVDARSMRTPSAAASAAVLSTALVLALGAMAGTALGATANGAGAAPSASSPGKSAHAPGQVKKQPTPPSMPGQRNLRTAVPVVAFTETVTAPGGHLRTPVLLADPTVTGTVRVVGAGQGNGCRGTLTQGVVTWLDCTVSTKATNGARIVVTLSDGRTATKEITAS